MESLKKKRRKYISYNLWLLALGCMLFVSCSEENNENSALAGNDIVSYTIFGYEGKTEINPGEHTVKVLLPDKVRSGRDLLPQFTLSEGARAYIQQVEQVSGESTVTFNSVITYRIVAGNQDEAQWKVSVTNNDYTISWGLGMFLTSGHSNESSRPDGFYRQQQHTGDASDYNCGPAVATMAALWADPDFTGTVEEARQAIPVSWHDPEAKDGWWYPQDVWHYLDINGIRSRIVELPGKTFCTQDDFQNTVSGYLDGGEIIVICLRMGFLTYSANQNPEFRVDGYYQGTNGHFILAKGYRKVDNVFYFEVHDPWGLDLKYADGTYKGANRYYRADELWKAAKDHNYRLVVVSH